MTIPATTPAATPIGVWARESGPVDGPVIVLVHGAMDRSGSMVRVARELDDEFRVVRYDRRGYGRSKPHDGPFTMAGHVADLLEVLDGRSAVVFGHSYGGNVALALAAQRPDLVRAVATYESPLSWFEWWPGTSRRWATGTSGETVAERFMRRMVGDATWESLPARVQAERRAEGVALSDEITDLVANPPWAREQITVPVVAMVGGRSVGHHRDGAILLAEWFGTDPIEIGDAGHHGPVDQPARVAAARREFAESVLR